MDCEARQEQLSQLLDGEAGAVDQPELFRHRGECAGCRSFLDGLAQLRGTVGRDRELSAAGADEIPLPWPRRAVTPGPDRLRAGRRLRLPVPAALAAALVLLLGGALLGAQWAGAGARGAGGRAPVVVVCSLPEIVVR